ncbi:MAG: hypothetical protein EBV23_13035 [Flavobacteriia bacterium]|jgi:hypothetical protein|nr:hypothetical protein [Flavobacteriia bacterium]
MSDSKKVAILRPTEGGWVLINKATGQPFSFIGEGLPVAEYLPKDWKVEEDLKNDYKQNA